MHEHPARRSSVGSPDRSLEATDRRRRSSGELVRGRAVGAASRVGRGRVQHGAVRLPGDPHRPELRRADHHVHQPAHRQLRRQRHRLRGARGCSAAASSCASWPGGRATAGRRPTSTRCCVRYGIPGHRRHRHPPPDPADPRHRRDPRRVRPGRRRSTTCVAAAASRAGHRRHRPRRHGHHAGAVHRRRRRARSASSPTTSASSARSCATSPGSARSRSSRRRRRPPTCSPASPTASSCPTARATRPRSPYAVEAIGELLGEVPDLRHLPRPPAARPGARRRDGQAAVRPPRRQPPGQGPHDRAPSRSPARTTTSPSPSTRSPASPT